MNDPTAFRPIAHNSERMRRIIWCYGGSMAPMFTVVVGVLRLRRFFGVSYALIVN